MAGKGKTRLACIAEETEGMRVEEGKDLEDHLIREEGHRRPSKIFVSRRGVKPRIVLRNQAVCQWSIVTLRELFQLNFHFDGPGEYENMAIPPRGGGRGGGRGGFRGGDRGGGNW